MVPTLIDRIDRWLGVNRPAYHAMLRPGATDDTLDAFERRFALQLPSSFRQLYRWRDGQDLACSEPLQHNRMFSSLAAIEEAKALLDGMIGSDFDDPRWWRQGWIPFLENYGGDHLCLDLTAENGGRSGQIIMFWHDWENRPIQFPDLESWLLQLVDEMESGHLELS